MMVSVVSDEKYNSTGKRIVYLRLELPCQTSEEHPLSHCPPFSWSRDTFEASHQTVFNLGIVENQFELAGGEVAP